MARRKRSSKAIEKAERRAAGLASIDPALDLGHGLTLGAYRVTIDETQGKLEAYSQLPPT